jgi:hypothetical protein
VRTAQALDRSSCRGIRDLLNRFRFLGGIFRLAGIFVSSDLCPILIHGKRIDGCPVWLTLHVLVLHCGERSPSALKKIVTLGRFRGKPAWARGV